MAGYEILFKESVFKDLQVIPKTDLRKILSRVERLADDPRPAGSQKLTGADLYRVRQGVQKRGMSPFRASSPRLHRRRLFPRSSVTMLEKRGMSPFFHLRPLRTISEGYT